MNAKLKKPLALGLAAALVAVAGYFLIKEANAPKLEERYRLQAVDRGGIRQTVSANGTLNPVTLVSVGTQVSGTVRKLYVDFNSKVEKGQVLAELDDALLSAQARQSAANVQAAAASLDLAVANEKRMASLLAQEYVSRQEYDQSLQALRAAQAQLALTRAQADKDRANLAYTVIRSPVSGVIVARSVDVGQTVAASFQTPTLFQIAQDLAKMQIDSSFAEADIGAIRVGQAVRFNVDAFPSKSFQGAVRQLRLNPTTQQNVVTYNVVVSVDNPEQILLPGMTAYVSIGVAERDDVLRVPNAALRFRPGDAVAKAETPADKSAAGAGAGGRNGGEAPTGKRKRDGSSGTVYVIREARLQAVSVALGITDNRFTEVLDGAIAAGDQVVIGDALPAGASGPPKSVGMRMF
ncbi:efflux RND transporter periplasmic adaptor subunit [Rhodocyclus tenuis]|uniref:efflux RND transporter periplasmic adaptor subunit n=1 Tax=Rhodocyclus tenuis TaxID=1066 RepID=UPI00190865DC|nr:efflux RND transporter periplasmic adaptor subunit [Rhodocyclus tenuis]MBK1679251.1 efflux transporter periplasmic adaptor subunit [Rhodocyclus tenuis]